MNRPLILLASLLLSSSCSSQPTAQDCRRHGVDVADGDVVTGNIVAEYYRPLDEVQAKCKGWEACIRAVGFEDYVFITPKGEYEIWYSDASLLLHERCHGWYEQTAHVPGM